MFNTDEFKLQQLQRWAIPPLLKIKNLAYEKKIEDHGLVHLEYGD